jgi:hypothetical protein
MGIPPSLYRRALLPCAAAGAFILAAGLVTQATAQPKTAKGPEIFNARASVGSAAGQGDTHVTVRIDRYTPEKELDAMERALKDGGSPAFSVALRRAPIVGQFEIGTQTFAIRWARQKPTPTGRVITAVIDKPVYFVGGGVPGAKPREGFDVAVVQLIMDSSGVGEGTMAAAARVKPGGPTGVEIDAYDAEPVKLRSVMRLIK